MIDPTGLLMIEPRQWRATALLNDALTQKILWAWRNRTTGKAAWRGVHICRCGAWSDNHDHFIAIEGHELKTNSLCVHYMACHRDEVPAVELAKVALLPDPPRPMVLTLKDAGCRE